MEHMIEQQIIALVMEALTNRTKRLELEDKVITLLNRLWDDNCMKPSPRRTVEVNSGIKMVWKSLPVSCELRLFTS